MKLFEEKEFLKELAATFHREQERYFAKSPMRPMLDEHFASGGKRLRPICAWLSAKETAKQKSREAELSHVIPYALAVELIHNATLVHDDIQDGDRVRRGHQTLWVRYGLPQGINCGDAWFFSSQLVVQEGPYEDFEKLALLKILQEKTLAVIEGQSREFVLKDRFQRGEKIRQADYEEMAVGKTSALFSMPLMGGALIGGASPEELHEIERASRALGLAFQIQDDLLDIWGDKGRDESASDIAEGKLSYPAVLALEMLPPREASRFAEILRKGRDAVSAAEVKEAVFLLNGVKEEAKKSFLAFAGEARKASALLYPAVNEIATYLEERVGGF